MNLRSVRVTGEEATGIEIISATQEIDVDRDITVKCGSKGATGIDIITVGREINNEVETGDGVTVSSAGGDAVGIHTAARSDGHIDLEVEGDTRVSSDSGESTGIAAYADRDSSVTIAIEGDLSTRG